LGNDTTNLDYGAVVVLYTFYAHFTIGWQSNMWIYPSELLPLKLRVRDGRFRRDFTAAIHFSHGGSHTICFPKTSGLPHKSRVFAFHRYGGKEKRSSLQSATASISPSRTVHNQLFMR
jgi:hypothetical protein